MRTATTATATTAATATATAATVPGSPSRRHFLASASASAGGLVLGFHIPAAVSPALAQGSQPEVNAWVMIHPDDTVVIRIARSEMGQGTLTGLAQLVAEELDCDWSRVTTEYPTPGQNLARNRVWGNFSTGGSRGIRESNDYVRKGGAAAKTMLVQAAAESWGVSPAECKVEAGVISHASGKRASYGQMAAAAAKRTPPTDIKLKDPKDWKIAGKPVKRLDTVAKTDGSQVYGMDLKLPGLLNAAIRDCPVVGGTLVSFEAGAVMAMPGVKKVLRVSDTAVAVVADTWYRAKKAIDALPVQWNEGPNAKLSSADIAVMLKSGLDAPEAYVGNSAGDAKAGLAGAAKLVEAVYSYPYQNHATMEVMNATARFTPAAGDKPARCEVWCPTQNGEAAFAAATAASGLPAAQCEVYKIHLGGGFGRRGSADYVTQAVAIARELPGIPVKLIWSREEDMQHGFYHPITQCKLRAGLDAQGKLQALHMRISGQSILAGLLPAALQNGKDPVTFQGLNAGGPEGAFGYSVPHLLIDHAMRNPPVRPGFWRGVNLNHNAIYVECFIDELAHAAGQDPLAFRRAMLGGAPKHLAVLNRVAADAGWGTPAKPVDGLAVHRGLAAIHGFGSFVAACAEVSVSPAGDLRVHRIVAATDSGHAVNPQQIAAQVEGSFAYGLSGALFEACTLKDGRFEQTNFHTYPALLMAQMPKVEAAVMPSGGFWGGVGEPTIAVAAPAVLNAIFAATGKRIRELPLSQHSLKRA